MTISLSAPNSYYASYYPNWSEDENWFLIELKEQYVTSGAIPRTNHRGDVYLVNTQTGENYRLTYTPTLDKYDIHWTDDGKIAFTEREVILRDFDLSIEEALDVPEVPREDIVMPEPIYLEDEDDINREAFLRDILVSPDSEYGAWITHEENNNKTITYELNFGGVFAYYYQKNTNFSIPLSDTYRVNKVLIGWRPSDYRYSIG